MPRSLRTGSSRARVVAIAHRIYGDRMTQVHRTFDPDGFADKARLAWRNVERCLAAAGFTLDHLVKVSMYIRDRRYRVANREVRHGALGDRRPALTVLVTDHWDEGWLIEIEAIAARPVMA